MAKRVPRLVRQPMFEGVAEIVGKSPGRSTWTDEELLAYDSIKLEVYSDQAMLDECKIFLYGLHTKTSPRSVAATLGLVWNMRSTDPIERRIFPEEDPGMDEKDADLKNFEEDGEIYTSDEIDMIIDGIDEFEVRRACSFLAASTLKMFAKDADSWMKAWENDHFQRRYHGFTKKDFPLTTLLPIKAEVDVMYEMYQGHKVYLGTLGRILYSLADVKDIRQTDMLFEQHLSCTGMHIIPQFVNAKMTMGCTTKDLLSALYMKQNEQTLRQLRSLIDNSLSKPPGPNNRGTWRYSRLFDPSAYALLQTKYAQDTVAILAQINSISQTESNNSNPLSIAVLRQMGPKRMKYAKAVAMNIYRFFTVTERAEANES